MLNDLTIMQSIEGSNQNNFNNSALPLQLLQDCPDYDPAYWGEKDEEGEPLFDVACYLYAINIPNAALADIHELGDIYAYKQPRLRQKLLQAKDGKGLLDAVLNTNALPKEQLAQFLERIKQNGPQDLKKEEWLQIKGLDDLIKALARAEKYHPGKVRPEVLQAIYQRYIKVVRWCVERDGLLPLDVPQDVPLTLLPRKAGCRLVALSFWLDIQNLDHHWYRLDRDGTWSHKPGQTPVRKTDSSQKPIYDPRSANLHPYTFACFYYVPVSTLLEGIEELENSSSDEENMETNENK